MRKVYLLRVFAYCSDYDNMANIWNFKSILFNDLKSAVKVGRAIVNEQLKELFRIDKFKNNYKKIDDFIQHEKDRIDYIFEVQETDMDKLDTWKHKDIIAKCGDLSLPHELAKYHSLIIQNPLYVNWSYDYKGNLRDRRCCYKPDANRLSGGAWNDGMHDGFSYLPNDGKDTAGKIFSPGDIIYENCDDSDEKKLYVITECPLKIYKHFYNVYDCYCIDNNILEYDFFHEEEISLFSGDAPQNILWLSKLYKNEIKISERDFEKIKNGEISFSELKSYRDIKS